MLPKKSEDREPRPKLELVKRPAAKSEFFVNQSNGFGLFERVFEFARRGMFRIVMDLTRPVGELKVLDVGVTSSDRAEVNFFEKVYPFPGSITAVGLEDASFLEAKYPGMKFVKADGRELPFEDKSFDLVVSFAVIEHVGTREQQRKFVQELCRVGKSCIITTPNRWYPLDFHTLTPLLHWLPARWFRKYLRAVGHDYFSREENLNLLTEREFRRLIPEGRETTTRHYRFLGPVSNLIFYLK